MVDANAEVILNRIFEQACAAAGVTVKFAIFIRRVDALIF